MSLYAKLWTDILGDEKLLRAERLGARHLYVLPWLLAFAKKADDDGRLTVGNHAAEPVDLAHGIPCISPKQIERGLVELEQIDVLTRDSDGALRFTNWERRSGHAKPSDTPDAVRGRVARHRAKKKVEDVTPGNALQETPSNGGELELEKELDIEKEKERDAGTRSARGGDTTGSAAEITEQSLRVSLADHWTDAERFLASRKSSTRSEWVREMSKLVGPGSQFTPTDLARACSDAMMLDRPIGGPHALRAFVLRSATERRNGRSHGTAKPGFDKIGGDE